MEAGAIGGTVGVVTIRTPHPWDAALAGLGAVALIVDGLLSQRSDGAVVPLVALALVTCAPLAWRRRAPLATLLLVGAGLIACIVVFHTHAAPVGVAMVALYTVAMRGDRRRSLVVGAATAVVLAGVIEVLQATGSAREGALGDGALRLLFVLGALVVGDTVRSRAALREAAAERDATLEREREQEARRRLDEERLRIARELHDTIAHALVAINVRAGVAAHLGGDRVDPSVLGEIKEVSAEALHDLRSTLDLLREPGAAAPTRPAQDLSAVPELVERARATGLDARAQLELDGTAIASPVGQVAFRIVQESLTNVLRHADATRARVRVRVAAEMLDVEVVDDGRGGELDGGGHGLRGMAERSGALGGSVVAGPVAGGGWRVHARLPLGVLG